MKKLKFLFSKKGVISLYGVMVALIACIMLCGYLDLTQTTHVVEEIQSIMDITALSTLQGSLDSEGVRFDRMTIKSSDYFTPDAATGISQAEKQSVNSDTNKDFLLEMLKADGSLSNTTIWLDGTNAANVNQYTVKTIILNNFNYYLQQLLYTDTGDALLNYNPTNVGVTQEYAGGSIIKKYEIREFDAGLIYSNWGVDAESGDGSYQKIPQAYIDTTIILYLNVEPTFSSVNVSLEESHIYNALTSSSSSSKLHVEGYTNDGLLVVSIRTLARMTVQGFIASDETPGIADITVSYDSLPYTSEEYFDITADGTVTGFSDAYYALPQAERPTSIKMPETIRGITPVKIRQEAFANPEDKIAVMVLPASVSAIGERAFADASSLKSFGFIGNSSLNNIGDGAFSGCSSLLSFTCPKNVTSIPANAFENCINLTSFNFPSNLTQIGENAFNGCMRLSGKLEIPDTVTSIGGYAFFNCASISSVELPKNLTSLGTATFGKTPSLINFLEIDSSNTMFVVIDGVLYRKNVGNNSYSLVQYPALKQNSTFTIPTINSLLVTEIEDYAFYGNKYLQELLYLTTNSEETKDMLHGIQSVGNGAFERCSALKQLQFAGDLVDDSGTVIRTGLISIGTDAFIHTNELKLVYIDKLRNSVSGSPWGANTSITAIRWKQDDSFDWSKVYTYTKEGLITGLTDYGADFVTGGGSLLIPNVISDEYWGDVTIKGIGDNAFSAKSNQSIYASANSKITTLEIAANITSIGKNAFRGTKLAAFALPETVTSVGDYAFAESAVATFVMTGNNALTFGNGVFMKSALTSIDLLKNVKSIGASMFQGCADLTSITLEADITEIPDYAFSGCIKLQTIQLPSTVKVIGAHAFEKCSILSGIDVKKVTTVGEYAFAECSTLAQLYFGENIATIEELAFHNTNNLGQVYLDVDEDSVLGSPWGAADYTSIVWRNSKWVKYYTYTAEGSYWRITGLSDLGRQVLLDGSLTALQTPHQKDQKDVISIAFQTADRAALKKLTSMKFNVSYTGGFEIKESTSSGSVVGCFEGCTALNNVVLTKGISKLSTNAFKGCTALTTIAVPDGVSSIGESAFEGCTALTTASLGSKVTVLNSYLFKNCTSLKTLGILGKVTTIGANAFENCTSLPSFHIKETISSIGDYAFKGCTSLVSVTTDAAPLTQFNTGLFYGCTNLKTVTLPGKVTTFKNLCFYNCSALTTLSGNNVSLLETIETNVFENCKALTTFPAFSSLKTIGSYAFKKCTGLTTFKSQDSLTTISANAFSGCTALKTFEAQKSLTELVDSLFVDCSSLTTVGNLNALTKIGNKVFNGCTALTTIGNMNELTTIGTSAFDGCSALSTIGLVDKLVTINSKAFYGCTKLSAFPEISTLTTIGAQAFENCTSFTTITLGQSISSVASNAFTGTSKLTDIYVKRPEFNDVQTNTSRSKNVPNDPWGSTATVHWTNTLKINDINVYVDSSNTDGYVACFSAITCKLDLTTKQWVRTLAYTYDGDINDLKVSYEGSANDYLALSVGTDAITCTGSLASDGYVRGYISDNCGNKGRISADLDNQIALSSYSATITPTITFGDVYNPQNGYTVTAGSGSCTIYYTGDFADLTVKSNNTNYVYTSRSGSTLWYSTGSYNGSATITVSDGTVSTSCTVTTKQKLLSDADVISGYMETISDSLNGKKMHFYYSGVYSSVSAVWTYGGKVNAYGPYQGTLAPYFTLWIVTEGSKTNDAVYFTDGTASSSAVWVYVN